MVSALYIKFNDAFLIKAIISLKQLSSSLHLYLLAPCSCTTSRLGVESIGCEPCMLGIMDQCIPVVRLCWYIMSFFITTSTLLLVFCGA